MAVKDPVFEETEWYATWKIQVVSARHVDIRNDRGMVNICRASKHHRSVLQPWMARYSGAFFSGGSSHLEGIFFALMARLILT